MKRVQEPAFFLRSTDGFELEEPRACYPIKRIRGRDGDDFLLVRIEPPIIGQEFGLGGDDIHIVVLATRHEGTSLHPVSEWPLHVHVARIISKEYGGDVLQKGDLEILSWGEINRS